MGTIRFLLAVSVVAAHAGAIFGFTFVDSNVAVEAFYIISGFYMTLILNEKYIGANDSYKLFITNRLLRLYPVYWFIIFLTILLSAFFLHSKYDASFAWLDNYLIFFDKMRLDSFVFLLFTNLFLFFQDLVMFLGLDTNSGELFFTSNFAETNPHLYLFLLAPQAWTIGIELAFYLIAPFIVKRNFWIVILGIAMSFAWRFILMSYGFKGDPWSYRFFPSELAFFLLGTLSYKLYVRIRKEHINLFCLRAIFFAIVMFSLFYGFLPVFFKRPAYLFLFFSCIPFLFLLTKNWKRDSYIGELSYPIYISHMLVLYSIQPWIDKNRGVIVLIITIVLSIALNELIAKKIERYRKKRLVLT